jgi:hypothetical protein
MNKSDSGFRNRLDGRTSVLAHNTPFLTGLSLIGVSVLTPRAWLDTFVWGVPYTAWKLAVLLKLWLSGTGWEKGTEVLNALGKRLDDLVRLNW